MLNDPRNYRHSLAFGRIVALGFAVSVFIVAIEARGGTWGAVRAAGYCAAGMIVLSAPLLWVRGTDHRRHRRMVRRLREGLCPNCGCDLRASGGICPECGATVSR